MERPAALGVPLAGRFWAYQRERFALAGFAPLVTAFAFSSAAYSRVARGAGGFIPTGRFVVGAFTALVFFFLLRVLDEHKDRDVDRRYRPELPVPRGLVSLAELRAIGGVALALAVALNAVVAPVLLMPMLVVAGWATLMTREFFVREWLRAHPTAYLLTHMAIMPLIDAYTTGLDWLVEGHRAPPGLLLFLAVTFLNGMVIEVGRKLRAPESEREGVDSYTRAWGRRVGPAVWVGLLAASAAVAWAALREVGAGGLTPLLAAVLLACILPAIGFLQRPAASRAAAIEKASQLWPLVTYLLLGALPFVTRRVAG